MTIMKNYKPCILCGKLGFEKRSETLPDKGTLIKVVHDDETVCKFEEYSSISMFLVRSKRTRDPKIMECPVCKQNGRINPYRPNKDRNYHDWQYRIVHEPLDGYWGKNQKIKRHRACYMKTDDQRKEVLRKLGRLYNE
jgi:hypothetical protein